MINGIKSTFDFVKELREFIIEQYSDEYYVYANYTRSGAHLIKNFAADDRVLLKPWRTRKPIGSNKTEIYIENKPTFKGHEINNYLFFAEKFRDNIKRRIKTDNYISLVEIDFDALGISVFGSMNIDMGLLNSLIEFADSIGYLIFYDFEGILSHRGFKKGVSQVSKVETRTPNPTIFVSYSWDNAKHKLWVLKLSSELIRNGVKIIIDEWDLEKYRNDLHFFMESGIRESDYVVMVCTPNFAKKANKRKGGVGIENTIITGEFYHEDTADKYIPLLRNYRNEIVESLPTYLKTKYAIDFNDDSKYDHKFEELLRRIFKVPRYKKPKLGDIPNLKSENI